MRNRFSLIFAGLVALAPLAAVGADSQSGHGMNHDTGMTMASAKESAMGQGVIQAVHVEKQMVTMAHDPIPDLDWPAMTMDFPVSKQVDLTPFKVGDHVGFGVKKGMDGQFRIDQMNKVAQ
ncbi:MAG: copper-binding protein [Magnetococcus sp. THC-1_WYH]